MSGPSKDSAATAAANKGSDHSTSRRLPKRSLNAPASSEPTTVISMTSVAPSEMAPTPQPNSRSSAGVKVLNAKTRMGVGPSARPTAATPVVRQPG